MIQGTLDNPSINGSRRRVSYKKGCRWAVLFTAADSASSLLLHNIWKHAMQLGRVDAPLLVTMYAPAGLQGVVDWMLKTKGANKKAMAQPQAFGRSQRRTMQ